MAKGDDSRARNKVDYAQTRGNELNDSIRQGVLTPQLDMFRNYYTDAANRGIGERQNILSGFAPIEKGYQNFADTGGYSPGDIANIRSRALAPASAVFARGKQEVERNRALQGGYSPGYGTLMSRMAREKGQTLSDASTNIEASIADLIRQGKLAGLAGLGNVQGQKTGLYGTGPGEAGLFGNQVLAGTNQLLENAGQSNQVNQAAAQGAIAAGQLPGKFQSAMGNITSALGPISQVGSVMYPWLNPGGSTGWSSGMSGYNRPNPSDIFRGGMTGI